MRIQSLNQRDDAKKDDGSAVIELSGLELIALNNILSKVSKEAECRSEMLFENDQSGTYRKFHRAA